MKKKKVAAAISVISNGTLIVLKIVAGIISGSISIISEAIHSLSDILASFIAFFSVSKSSEPADDDHSFGHGKYEDLSGLIEGALIIFAGLYIFYEATKKIVFHTNISLSVDLGILIMAISAIVNIAVSSYLFNVAKKTDSLAIYADAEHLRTDILSSFSVCLGLVLIKITNIPILDPIIALIVALVILHAGYKICKKASENLLDKSLDKDETDRIKQIISEFLNDKLISVKALRTRKSGLKKNIEIILIANGNMTIKESHEMCDLIEQKLESIVGNTDVTIHLEPEIVIKNVNEVSI